MSTATSYAPANGLRLYEMSDELAQIQAELIENGGELTDSLAARLDAIEGDFAAKVERCVALAQQLKANGAAAKAEADRLRELADSRTKASDRLKDYVRLCMERAGQTRLDLERFRVWVQANSSDTVRFEGDPEALPVEFQRFTVALDAAAVRAAHAEGRELPEGIEVVRGSHLRIK